MLVVRDLGAAHTKEIVLHPSVTATVAQHIPNDGVDIVSAIAMAPPGNTCLVFGPLGAYANPGALLTASLALAIVRIADNHADCLDASLAIALAVHASVVTGDMAALDTHVLVATVRTQTVGDNFADASIVTGTAPCGDLSPWATAFARC